MCAAACARAKPSSFARPNPVGVRRAAVTVDRKPFGFAHGICYAHAWRDGERSGYGTDVGRATLGRLRGLGVDAVSLTPFGYESALGAPVILANHYRGGENDRALYGAAAHAHALGMQVMLKPHLWVRGGHWAPDAGGVGAKRPPWIGSQTFASEAAWQRWFESYRVFILHYAKLAASAHIEWLAIGTELEHASARDRAGWQRLIGEIREIYPGKLTYAANWNEEGVVFWDLLDAVGVQEYEPVAARPDATLDELRKGWAKVASHLAALAKKTGKPILITELGYRASPDAGMSPSAWPERDPQARFDGDAQARCYRAALEVLTKSAWCRGVYIWKWFTDSRDEEGPTDFSPAGKPAEQVLGELYREVQRRPVR